MSISVRFFPRTESKNQADPLVRIYCRLKVNGIAATDFSTKVGCLLSAWHQPTQRIKGRSGSVAQDNIQLERIITDLKVIYNDLLAKGKTCNATIIRTLYLSKTKNGEMTLLKSYRAFLEQHRADVAKSSLKNWFTFLHNTEKYLASIRKADLALEDVTPQFVEQYQRYLRTYNANNQILKHTQALKRIINYAIAQGYLEHNCIAHIKGKKDLPKPKVYLSADDLTKVQTCSYFNERLQKVADFFLIQCYTGMTYADLVKFDRQQHVQQGERCDFIVIQRTKSDVFAQIPVLPPVKNLMEKYDWRPPVISLDKTNQFLEEISRVAELNVKITTYTARYTMAMYLLNVAKVRIETVSAILGHTNVLTTQRFYAKLTRKSIEDELGGLLG